MSEVGEKQHASDEEAAKEVLWKHRIEIVTTLIMAITAIAIAWSSYQAALWGGEQSTNYSKASSKRVESVRSSLTGYQAVIVDLILFTDWIDAVSTDNQAKADFLKTRMRTEMEPALNDWLATDPFNDPAAPSMPFYLDSYRVSQLEEATRLEEEAAEFFELAQVANQHGDEYVLNTVWLASVLFFAGIATRFKARGVQIAITILATALLVIGLVNLATVPIA